MPLLRLCEQSQTHVLRVLEIGVAVHDVVQYDAALLVSEQQGLVARNEREEVLRAVARALLDDLVDE